MPCSDEALHFGPYAGFSTQVALVISGGWCPQIRSDVTDSLLRNLKSISDRKNKFCLVNLTSGIQAYLCQATNFFKLVSSNKIIPE